MRIAILTSLMAAALACAPAADQSGSAPAAPDTAAVRAALQDHGNSWAEYDVAGNAAGLTGLLTEDGIVAVAGSPTAQGSAALQSLFTSYLGTVKVLAAASVVTAVAAPAPGIATAIGTYTTTTDSSGVVRTGWYRWAASYRQGPDGQWRASYLMSIPDSVVRK